MDFLDLLNNVARFTRPAHLNLAPLESMDQPFVETEIDSLDGLMIVMYYSIIYDIEDDLVKDFNTETPQQLADFIEKEKKRECESIEEAMEMIK